LSIFREKKIKIYFFLSPTAWMNKLLSQKKISAEFEKQDLHEDDLQRDKKTEELINRPF
jgi:hypothetical protein